MYSLKILVLGGAGGMGSTACRQLARQGSVEIVVADRDGEGAARVAAEIRAGGARATSCAVDLMDRGAARGLLAGADLALQCAGPFFRLGVPVLEAAIDVRTPYLDICDDPEPTRAMLALDERARRAGVFAVIGMGASPGLSNLLALRASRRLDRVDDCFTAWPLDGATVPGAPGALRREVSHTGAPSAAAVHLIEQISGRIGIVENGEEVQRRPLEAVALDYPGFGRGTAYTVGHPEPLTLGAALGVRGRAANVMLLRRTTVPFLRSLGADVDRGALTHEAAAAALLAPPTGRAARAVLQSVRVEGPGSLPPFFALLQGARAGRRLRVCCHVTSLPQGMYGATATPAALAVGLLLRQPPPPGVHAPEAAIDPDALLAALAPLCPGAPASVDALAPVVEA